MRIFMQKYKLVTFLLAWSTFTAAYLFVSYSAARVHFEQYMQYASFAPEWKPRYVEIGPQNLFWTMWVPKFPAMGKVEYGEESFFVTPAENARLIQLCKERQIPVHGAPADNIPYTEVAVCITPALLALWLLWRRRERRVTIKQLGCAQTHGAKPISAEAPIQEVPAEITEAKTRAMKDVHVFSLRSSRREFIKRL
jgi:hypothetical protein